MSSCPPAVMGYDVQSQMWDESAPNCASRPNAPLRSVVRGLAGFLYDLGVPRDKLVLGVPWYGYHFRCRRRKASKKGTCWIDPVPFR